MDCDVLNDSDTDLKIVIYTAAPGSEDETKLDLARVAGTRPVRPVHRLGVTESSCNGVIRSVGISCGCVLPRAEYPPGCCVWPIAPPYAAATGRCPRPDPALVMVRLERAGS